jgi:hypothetical protein
MPNLATAFVQNVQKNIFLIFIFMTNDLVRARGHHLAIFYYSCLVLRPGNKYKKF